MDETPTPRQRIERMRAAVAQKERREQEQKRRRQEREEAEEQARAGLLMMLHDLEGLPVVGGTVRIVWQLLDDGCQVRVDRKDHCGRQPEMLIAFEIRCDEDDVAQVLHDDAAVGADVALDLATAVVESRFAC